jgi:hypothetical protein
LLVKESYYVKFVFGQCRNCYFNNSCAWGFNFFDYNNNQEKKINHWGCRVALLFVLGLLVCIFVAIRDNYHLSVINMTNPNIAPGVFTAESIQSTLCCLGGAIIAFCSLSSVIIRRQGYLKTMFFILSATIILKAFVIEISRIALL